VSAWSLWGCGGRETKIKDDDWVKWYGEQRLQEGCYCSSSSLAHHVGRNTCGAGIEGEGDRDELKPKDELRCCYPLVAQATAAKEVCLVNSKCDANQAGWSAFYAKRQAAKSMNYLLGGP